MPERLHQCGLGFFNRLSPMKSSTGQGGCILQIVSATIARHTRPTPPPALLLSSCAWRETGAGACWLPHGFPPPPILFRASIEHKTTRIGQGARRPMESLVVLDLQDWTPPTVVCFDWA